VTYITDSFKAGGHIDQRMPSYLPRPQQLEYAQAVHEAVADPHHLIAEAPTGIGKSLGYLVPVSNAVATTKRKAVIVTAGITLQEQLLRKDLPMLQDAVPWHFSYALRKGLSNYVCLYRLTQSRAKPPGGREVREAFDRLSDWERTSACTGDRSDADLPNADKAWHLVSTNHQDCLRGDCTFKEAGRCYAYRAFKGVAEAQIVVTNYHVLFADLQLYRLTGDHHVLPPYDILVMDEAHQAADVARQFFGFRVTRRQCARAAKLLNDDPLDKPRMFRGLMAEINDVFAHAETHYGKAKGKKRITEAGALKALELAKKLHDAGDAYQDYLDTKRVPKEVGARLKGAIRRCEHIVDALDSLEHLEPNLSYFVAKERSQYSINAWTIRVDRLLHKTLFADLATAVATSATLEVDRSFGYILGELGMKPKVEGSVGSPFDFSKQALAVTPGMPEPNADNFPDAVRRCVDDVIQQAKGRTLVLCTSYKMLKHLQSTLQPGAHTLMCQGDRPRIRLIDAFRKDTHSVLLGTESFWSGVDVPGESLSCVVMDRLPFRSPDDPISAALSDLDSMAAFQEWTLPRAVVLFRQAVGRLIRTVDDRGVVVLLDRRLLAKNYGGMFWSGLPEGIKHTYNVDDIGPFLEGGAR